MVNQKKIVNPKGKQKKHVFARFPLELNFLSTMAFCFASIFLSSRATKNLNIAMEYSDPVEESRAIFFQKYEKYRPNF